MGIRFATAREFCTRLATHRRFVPVVAAVLLAGHAGLLACSARRHSPTLNEPAHLVAGISHWKFGRFELYRVNPPLVRMVAALPVMAAGSDEDWGGFYESPAGRPEFSMGEDFISANGERSIWLFTIARWACIPISLAGGLFCFLWSRELWRHKLAGLLSLALWCFDPNILAHGELITPDSAASAFGLGAGYFFWRWLRQPNWRRAVAAGALLGLAELSKMTWVILFALWPLLWLFWLAGRPRNSPDDARPSLRQCGQLAIILFVGLDVLNLGYGFNGSFHRLERFSFVSSALTGEGEPRVPGNRFADTILGRCPVPLPEQYLLGMDVQMHDFEDYGQPSYLRGEWKDGGWWYYYLYGLAVKTPHGTQFLLVLAVLLMIQRWWTRPSHLHAASPQVDGAPPVGREAAVWRDLVILLAPAITLLVLASSQLEFNHHVRYVLPVLGFTFVFIGVTGRWASTRGTQEHFDGGRDTDRSAVEQDATHATRPWAELCTDITQP